jgi:hypothetical protein
MISDTARMSREQYEAHCLGLATKRSAQDNQGRIGLASDGTTSDKVSQRIQGRAKPCARKRRSGRNCVGRSSSACGWG